MTGELHKRFVEVEAKDPLTLIVNGGLLSGKEAAVILDARGRFLTKSREALVGMTDVEIMRLSILQNQLFPGAFQDVLDSLWHRAEVRSGERKGGKKQGFLDIMSAGLTRTFDE